MATNTPDTRVGHEPHQHHKTKAQRLASLGTAARSQDRNSSTKRRHNLTEVERMLGFRIH